MASRAIKLTEWTELSVGSSAGHGGRSAPAAEEVTSLTAQARRGDADAFERLYRAWFPRVLALAKARTGRDEAWCLDVTQTVMMRAARSLPVVESAGALLRWFSAAVVHASMDAARAERRRASRERRRALGEAVITGEISASEQAQALLDALEALPGDDYEVISVRLARGCSLAEAGRVIGLTEDAAHGRLRRAVAKLRRAMGGEP